MSSLAVPPQGGQVPPVAVEGRAWQQAVRQSQTSLLQHPTALMSVLNLQVWLVGHAKEEVCCTKPQSSGGAVVSARSLRLEAVGLGAAVVVIVSAGRLFCDMFSLVTAGENQGEGIV